MPAYGKSPTRDNFFMSKANSIKVIDPRSQEHAERWKSVAGHGG
jgi:hypothetical protein